MTPGPDRQARGIPRRPVRRRAAELTQPWQAINDAGAETVLIAPETGNVQAMEGDVNEAAPSRRPPPSVDADAATFDAVVLPGGTTNADQLRVEEDAVAFLTEIVDAGKPVASICHGPWTLVETGRLEGKTLTSFPSLQTDLRNAGATWVDEESITCPTQRVDPGHQPQPRRPRRVLRGGRRGVRLRRRTAARAPRGQPAAGGRAVCASMGAPCRPSRLEDPLPSSAALAPDVCSARRATTAAALAPVVRSALTDPAYAAGCWGAVTARPRPGTPMRPTCRRPTGPAHWPATCRRRPA